MSDFNPYGISARSSGHIQFVVPTTYPRRSPQFQALRDYLLLQIFPDGFDRAAKKAFKRKAKKFRYDARTNHLFHYTQTQVGIFYLWHVWYFTCLLNVYYCFSTFLLPHFLLFYFVILITLGRKILEESSTCGRNSRGSTDFPCFCRKGRSLWQRCYVV